MVPQESAALGAERTGLYGLRISPLTMLGQNLCNGWFSNTGGGQSELRLAPGTIATGDTPTFSPGAALARVAPYSSAPQCQSIGFDAVADGRCRSPDHELDESLAELERLQRGGCQPQGCTPGPAFTGATFQFLSANDRVTANSIVGNPVTPPQARGVRPEETAWGGIVCAMNAPSRTTLGGSTLLLMAPLLGACTTAPGGVLGGDPVYSTRHVSASDRSGVASVSCPTTHRIVGGGCSCEGVGDVLFGSEPAGNGQVCGCYDFGPSGGAATATAICLGSSVPGTLTQGLASQDPAVASLVERYRELRTGARSP